MNKNTANRKVGRLHTTEYRAYKYLLEKGISIDLRKKNLVGAGDLISFKGIQYEVKRIRTTTSLRTYFTKQQLAKFLDNYIILFFLPYKSVPDTILYFAQIKKFIKPSGYLAYSKISTLEQVTL